MKTSSSPAAAGVASSRTNSETESTDASSVPAEPSRWRQREQSHYRRDIDDDDDDDDDNDDDDDSVVDLTNDNDVSGRVGHSSGNKTTPKKKKTKTTRKNKTSDWLDSESESDSVIEARIANNKAQMARDEARLHERTKNRKAKRKKTHSLVFRYTLLSQLPKSKRDKLKEIGTAKIPTPTPSLGKSLAAAAKYDQDADDDQDAETEARARANQGLQMLLWSLGCDYSLLDHQFLGVRAIAGLAPDFPGPTLYQQLLLPRDSDDDDSDADHDDDDNSKKNRKILLYALKNAKPRLGNEDTRRRQHHQHGRQQQEDRGLIFADVMGLGKTVQSVAALIIRNAIAAARNQSPKPTLICSPNDAVREQWRQHLFQGGIHDDKIVDFKTKQSKPLDPDSGLFFLCTRYDLMAEAKYILDSLVHTKSDNAKAKRNSSPIFPYISTRLLEFFHNQYLYSKGDAKNKFVEIVNGTRLKVDEVVARQLAREAPAIRPRRIFQTVIFDEAHFLKNLKTYWSMSSAFCSLHSERVVLLSGTPYNNNLQDMATLVTFINPAHDSAKISWWKDSTERGAATVVQEKLSQWSNQYLVRREKNVIADSLPPKIIRKEHVAETNLGRYNHYEEKFMSALKQVQKLSDGEPTRALRDAMRKMLAMASCMQLSLVHPILPGGGRQLSILFSPSLCTNTTVKKRQENRNRCVCCDRRVKLAIKKGKGKKGSAAKLDAAAVDLDELESDDEQDDDDEVDDDDDEAVFGYKEENDRMSNDAKGTGDIVAIPSDICEFASRGIRHFACESCLASIEAVGGNCPMCVDLIGRCCSNDGKSADDDGVYCSDVFGGFRPSAKLEKILSDFKTKVPAEDKVLIASFFKGSLDFLEAMFHRDGIEVARFDGDVKGNRQQVLDNFKTSKTCRILLMTVQTGGTGLNIAEANHVWFVERYWNPMVMEQCEDRCWRYGQKKEVDVAYLDVPLTFDDIMRYINERKASNAAIVLSDSVALSNANLSFTEITGFLGHAISALRFARAMNSTSPAEDILKDLAGTMPESDLPSFIPRPEPTPSFAPTVPEYPRVALGNRIGSLPQGREDWGCPYCTFLNRGCEGSHHGSARVCSVCGYSSLAGFGHRTMAVKLEEDVPRTPSLVSPKPPKRKIPDDAEIIEID